ncbi:MAG: aminotransferase class III-fold pyridoxal phosphate-dependent enzyme [Bdellovibrionales bacterium]|nr:aminotransferase class III-fold pyridoxal phosphate-dependent enzyme [Bdellovibrionales bacterium]
MELFPVYALNDITIVRASGARVFDPEGTQYLDFYGGHAVISIGHGNPVWKKRITDQLEKISFYSNSIHMPIQRELAHKLGKVSGKTDYSLFLCNSGAEANENAFKLASFHTNRKKIVAFKKAFHGRTSLAVSATDNPALVAPVNATDNVTFLPFNDVEALDTYFLKHGADTAAVIIEGIQGVGGIHVATAAFLRAIRTACDRSGAVYIADGIQCGHGRSGHFFSHDHAGTPGAPCNADLYTMAKGMGNGFPVAGVLIHPKFQPKVGMLGTTFGGNPLACAAALGVLEVMEQDQLMVRVRENGKYLWDGLAKIPGLLNLRGMGLMLGFDLPEERKDLRTRLLREYRIFTGEAKPNTVRLLPALNITRAEIDELLSALRTVSAS